MLDPHPYSDQEHRDIHKLELRPPYEEGSPKLFENTLQAAAPSRMNRPGEGTSELGLGSHSMEEGFEARSNPQRVCRICHRQFSSGRALGGHMRVHGPLFIPAAGRKRKLILTDSDSEGGGEQEEGEGEEAVLDAAASLSIEADSDFLPMNRITGDLLDGDHADGDGYRVVGTEYYMAAHDKEHGSSYSLDVSRSSELADYDSMAKKNALYELRHNPKKSRRFTDEDLSTRMLASAHGMTMNSPSKSSLLPTSERTRVCSVCGKEFWSWKALSGHMRCHPEREWRGVLPPTGKAGSRYNYQKRSYVVSSFGESSDVERVSDVEDKDDVEAAAGMGLPLPVSKRLFEEEEIIQDGGDVKDCVSSPNTADYDSNSFWPTGKRSRRRSGDMKARSLQSSPQQVHGDPALIASETTSLADLGEEQHFQVHNFLFMLAEAAQAIEGGFADAGKSNMFVFKGTSASEQDAQAFLADSKDIGNAKAGTMKFECSTCKRSFNSPQALGGHRASHRKTKGCFARTSMGEEESAEQLGHEFAPLRHGFSKEKDSMKKEKQQQQVQSYNKGYECSVCHRVFLTGQALGGHKSRCHFTGEKVAEAAASVMSSNKQLPRRGHSSKHDDGSILDLNLPASTIEDGEVRSEAIELNLFTSDQVSEVERKVDTWTTDSPREELSLGAPWAAKHLSRSTSWELEGRWPAVEPGMAF